jgi:WD40 repeat protein
MANVFISYSRQDKTFVERLHAALVAAQRETWVDWQGIPPSAEWLGEVYAAIESADTFIFVLSPDSLTSEICRSEVDHALGFKKRIIPIVCRDIEDRQIMEPIAALNWIFFRPSDDFDAAFQKLLFALDTDLEYWRQASELLTRARQWEAQQKNNSFVLRGHALTSAEHWLAEGANKQPNPTKLHIEFITASRRAVNNRQRATVSVMSVILAVLVVLTLVSYNFSQIAQAQERVATHQKTVALSRQLAAEANLALLHNQPDVALLLSAKSFETNENLETRNALLATITDDPHLQSIGSDDPSVSIVDVAFEPHGVHMFTLAADGTIERWSFPDLSHKLFAQGDGTYNVERRLLLSPDGKQLISVATDGLRDWDTTTGDGPSSKPLHLEQVTSVRFTADGSRLMAVTCESATGVCRLNKAETLVVSQWDGATLAPIGAPIRVSTDYANDVAFSPDGKLLAENTCADPDCRQGHIALWDLATGKLAGQFALDQEDYLIHPQFDQDGKTLWASEHNHLQLWDVATQQSRAKFNVAMAAVNEIVVSPDRRSVVFAGCADTSCQQGQILMKDTQQLPAVNIPFPIGEPFAGHIQPVSALAFAPDSNFIVSVDGSNRILIWRLTAFDAASRVFEGDNPPITGQLFAGTAQIQAASRLFTDAVLSPDGKSLAATVIDAPPTYTPPYIALWDATSGRRSGTIDGADEPVFSPDGKMLAGVTTYDGIALYDASTHERLRTLTAGEQAQPVYLHPSFSGDGRTLTAQNSKYDQTSGQAFIVFWDVNSGTLKYQLPVTLDNSTSFAWTVSKDGKSAAVATGNLLRLWDTGDAETLGQLPGTLVGHTDAIQSVAFSPDGRMLASIDASGTAILWDVATRHVIAQINNGQGTLTTSTADPFALDSSHPKALVAFSPDGRLLVSSWGTVATVWDIKSNELYLNLPHMGAAIQSLAFGPDSRSIVWSAHQPVGVYTRSFLFSQWQAAACQMANRALSPTEWQEIDPTEKNRTICPT